MSLLQPVRCGSAGEYRLDDLAESFAQLAQKVNGSVTVNWIAIYAPVVEGEAPAVQISVEDADSVRLLRCSVADNFGESVVADDLQGGFKAETGEVDLVVWSAREGFQ